MNARPMTFQDDHIEGAQAMEREARALADGELESRRVAAERALTELRRQLQDAVAWLDALERGKGSPVGPASRGARRVPLPSLQSRRGRAPRGASRWGLTGMCGSPRTF
jgi:hypothetical protein